MCRLLPAVLALSLLSVVPGHRTAQAATSGVALMPAAGQFMPLAGTKVLDSRDGTGVANPTLTPGSTLSFSVRSVGGTSTGVPADATAVVLEFNVQANFSGAVSTGADTSSTDTSVTFPANTERNGFDIVTPASDGTVGLSIKAFSPIPSGAVMSELVVRLHGYYTGASTTTAGSTYVGYDPALLADTNGGSTVVTLNGAATTGALTIGTPAGASGPSPYTVQVTGNAGVPADGSATAVALQVNVQNPTCTGGFSLVPGGSARTDWDGSFTTGENDENFDLVQLPASGQLTLRLLGCSGTADVVIRVRGYYSAPTFSTPGASFTPTQRKVFDTTTGTGTANCATTSSSPQLAAHTGCTVQVLGTGSIPATGVAGLAAQVVAVNPTNDGWLGLYSNSTVSHTSTLSYSPGGRTSNFEVASYTTVNADGTVYVYNGGDYAVDVVVRVHGYDTAPQVPAPPAGVTDPVFDATGSSASVTWTAPPKDGGAATTGYQVMAHQDGSTAVVTGYADATARAVTLGGLDPTQYYWWSLTAINAVGTGDPNYPPGKPGPASADDGTVMDPSQLTTPTAPTASGPATIAGRVLLPDGTPASGFTVHVLADPTSGDDTTAVDTELGQATTGGDGNWSFTVPPLSAALQADADANGGVLNTLAVSSGLIDGTNLATVAAVEIPAAVGSSAGMTTEAATVRQQLSMQTPTAMLYVNKSYSRSRTQAQMDDANAAADRTYDTTAVPTSSVQNRDNLDATAQADGTAPANGTASTTTSTSTPTSSTTDAMTVDGINYTYAHQSPVSGPAVSGAEVAMVSPTSCSGTEDDCASWTCGVNGYQIRHKSPYGPVYRYDVVGEVHAYWDAYTYFSYAATHGSSFDVGVSFDAGSHFKVGGSTHVGTSSSGIARTGDHGPYFAREYRAPFKWVYQRTQFRCVYGATGTVSPWYDWFDRVNTHHVVIPPDGTDHKWGADKSWGDGYLAYENTPSTHRMRLSDPGDCHGNAFAYTWSYQGEAAFSFSPWEWTALGYDSENQLQGEEGVCRRGSTLRRHYVFTGPHDNDLSNGPHALNSY